VPVWSEFAGWEKIPATANVTAPQRAFRESVARGARVFREKMFLITDSAGINSPIGFGNPVRNSCVFCHNMSQMGNDVAPGQVDLGTQNAPFADPAPHLPAFKVTCLKQPHPHYGSVIHTYDPGYALTTGKCADVGKITLQSNRGLAARAPYFSNGSAKTLRDVIDYYERRYNIGYTEQEKQDLVNLMSVL
jgi:cytochrome c peroxidase